MAIPTCPKCSSTSFQLSEYSPLGGNYKYNFIICSSCGCIVGSQEYYNIGASLFETPPTLNDRFAEVKDMLSTLQSLVRHLH